MHLMILCPVWLLLGTFTASAWSWTKDGFVDSVLSEYGKYDQAARADMVKDGVITESEFMTSLYRQADSYGNNDNKVSRDEFIDYYGQRYNISSELGTVMFDILNDANTRDEFITSADVSIGSFSGKNYATVAEFRDGLEKWLRQSADRLYNILMSPHVLESKREPEIKYSVLINSVDANNDDVISTEELNDEIKRMNSNQPVRRRDWVWRNTQRYGSDPVTANLVFDYWDRDRDFQLTPRDMQFLEDDMDLNGDSKVDHDEFLRFVERGYKLSKRMTARPLTLTLVRCPEPWWDSLGWSPNVDADRAAMDFDDDLNGWVSVADLRRWLDVFDDDDDKAISRREYTKFHTDRYGVNSSVASAMFDLSDINGDDKISEQDWEFHFRDGFSLSFCDARRSILDLTRMAEQFRGVRQGRELRESMQRRLQDEWSWYLQNKQQGASSSRYLTDTYDRDSKSRQQDLCGSRTNCYVGEYTESWGQPGAWLWWGIKSNLGRPEVLQTQFGSKDGSLPRPPLGFPNLVNEVPSQINRFIGPGSQIGQGPILPAGIPVPALGGPGPVFDQPPWLGILGVDPIGGVAPFPRFRRAVDNDGNKSEKSESGNYFSTYHRLRSPFSESVQPEPTPTPVFKDQQLLSEQRHEGDKQQQDPVQRVNTDETANSNLESSRIRSNSLEPQRIRAPADTTDKPAEKAKPENGQEGDNLDLDQSWLTSQLPILGYPVVLGFDPWMFGGYPNWGLLGRKKREDDGINSEDGESPQQDTRDVAAVSENSSVDSANRTVDGEELEDWESTMLAPPGFGMLPWDFWMAWNFDNAMWDVLRLLHELNNRNSSDASNDTDTNDILWSESDLMPLLETNGDHKEGGHAEEESSRKKRSSDGDAPDDEVKGDKESVNNTKDHDKRFAQIPGNRYGSYWPFFLNRARPQYVPVFARYWPVVIPPPKDFRLWPNSGIASSLPSPWVNPLFPQYPWSNGNGQFNLWENIFRTHRFRREAHGSKAESVDKERDREQRAEETESSRRDSSQGNENSAGDTGDSVWRSAARKYATKENWEQQGSEAADDRFDYSSGGAGNQNEPTQTSPSQPWWLKNILSGTGDRWKNAQFQQYRNMWDPTYARPYDWNLPRPNLWSNVAPSALPPAFVAPGSVWPEWEGSFDGSMFPNQDGINTFGGVDPWAGSPFWVDQWQNSFGGSPGNWLSLRDTSSFKDIDSLLKLWYGRFSREAGLNTTAEEGKSKDEDKVEKEELRTKRDAVSEEQTREKRWGNEFSETDSPFSSFQGFPSWGAWCKVYWSVVRHKRGTEGSDNDNTVKRSDITAKGAKEKRWNEWNDNQQESNWLSSFLDLVCPLALHSRPDFDWQGGITDSSLDATNPYSQFRTKRESGTDNSAPGDATAGNPQPNRLQRWWNSYSDDYDCLEWISSISAWSPWKGWNLLRSSREKAAVRTDSTGENSAGMQVRNYDNKDNRAVRCRAWYRKYRESNRKIRGENNKDDDSLEGESNLQISGIQHDHIQDAGQNVDNANSKVRHRRETTENNRLKRYGQMNFQPSWMPPYTSSQHWNRQSYPYSQDYQSPAPWFGPGGYSSFSYDPRRNSPLDYARGLRNTDDGAEDAEHTSQKRQKRSNEDSERSKRFWNQGNDDDVFGFDWTGQSRLYDNGNQWGWPVHSYSNRPPMYSMFTDYRIPQSQSTIQNWIRQQRNVGSVGQSDDGKHNADNASRKKRESLSTGFQKQGILEDNALAWFSGLGQQDNPGFWNDHSWMLKRHRRDSSVEPKESRDKRFSDWANMIPNAWDDFRQQSLGPFRNAWGSYPDQLSPGRFSRDVGSKNAEHLNQIKERAGADNSKTKRQLGSPAFYPMSQRYNWGTPREYGKVVPQSYNYWGGAPRMHFNWWDPSEAFWRAMRFTRESNNNEKVDDSDKTISKIEDLSRRKRWDNTNFNFRAFNNDRDIGFGYPVDSSLFGIINPNQWEGNSNWNTRSFFKRNEKQEEGSRSRRSTSESNKEKRWFGQQGEPTFPWLRLPFPNSAQSYVSGYGNPWMPSSYPQRGFDWQRSSSYPWSESWKVFQRGPYDRNEDFPSQPPFLGSSWDRFPRKSINQGGRIKRETQHDAQTKRWSDAQSYSSNYDNLFVPLSYPQREFDWQQRNMYPWRSSQRGYYGGSDDFPQRAQFWRSPWDFQRYPRQSKEQGQSRLKRNIQQETKAKRWQTWRNIRFPLDNIQNPYNPGSFGSNGWMGNENGQAGNFWNSVRNRRETQPEVNQQNVQDGKVNKRWFLNGKGEWPANGQYEWPISGYNQWPMRGQYQWPNSGQYQWPFSGQYQWPVNDQWYPYNYLNSRWAGGNWDKIRYPRKTPKDKGNRKKRSTEAWNFNRPWQRGGFEPWSVDSHWNRFSPTNNWQGHYLSSPMPFGFGGLNEWTSKMYIRNAENENGRERTKRDTETKTMEKRWQGNYRNPFTSNMDWGWSPYNTGYDRNGFFGIPTRDWGREYPSDFYRFQTRSTEDSAPGRHKRDAEQETREKRWQGGGLFSNWPDRRQNVYGYNIYGPQNRFDAGNNLGSGWPKWPQPGWENVWNSARFRRSLDKNEATKSKRWQQDSGIPWFTGNWGQDWASPWNREWGGSSVFDPQRWQPAGGFQRNWPNEANLGRGFSGIGNMWRFPRRTSDSAEKDDGERQKREISDSSRDKRWQNWNTNPFFNWGPMDTTYTNPGYARYAGNPSFNTRGFFKRDTKESKNANEAAEVDHDKRSNSDSYFSTAFPKSLNNGMGIPTELPWSSGDHMWGTNRNSHRFRRNADGIGDGNKETVDDGVRNKRQSFWYNVFENRRSSEAGFPGTFPNPWTGGNNWWDRNWNSRRYRRGAGVISGETNEVEDSGVRNKRQNYLDNNYRVPWTSETGFPTSANPWNARNNLRHSNWNSLRHRRSTDGITGENNRNKRQNYGTTAYGESWSNGAGSPSTFENPWTSRNNWGNTDWNIGRYRRSTGGISEENKENVRIDLRSKRQNYWDNNYGNIWGSRAGYPTFGSDWWGSQWDFRRYRRGAAGTIEGDKQNVDSNDRNKRGNYWDNVFGNTWGRRTGFPSSFGNPWLSNSNWWDSGWNSRRYRRSTDGIGGENKENINPDVRKKRENYWDNVFGKSFGSGAGFPWSFGNPGISSSNFWGSNWNFRRYHRNTDVNSNENKGDLDVDARSKRQNYWDNLYGNSWSSGGRFPAPFPNPWTQSNNWWNSGWNYPRYRRNAHTVGEQSEEKPDSGGRNKRQNYWDNVLGQPWNKNWLAPNWPRGGTYPYRIVFVLTSFFGPWSPSFGQNSLWNRYWNQPPERYFRDTTNAEQAANNENGDTIRNKRSLNVDFMKRHGWNTNDNFIPVGDNSNTFSQRNFDPYVGTNNRFLVPDQRFYRDTEDGKAGKERFRREADNMSRVKRFGNRFLNYQSYPPMYYANSWGQDPMFNAYNWFSPVSPWFMSPRMAQFINPWFNPFFFGALRNLRQIKGADVNETVGRGRRETVPKAPRQAPWFNLYNRPYGLDSFQLDNPFRGMPSGFRNPTSGARDFYRPWNPMRSWDNWMTPRGFDWSRGLRDTDTKMDDQKRSKREVWGSHTGQNSFRNGRPYGSNWNNPDYTGMGSVNSWSPGQRWFSNTDRPGGFSQQWRNSPLFQWDQGFAGYSPMLSKRDSVDAKDASQDKGEALTKRDAETVTSQRSKRWWKYNGVGDWKPQNNPDWQRDFDTSNPWYPERSNAFQGDSLRGGPFRRKRDVSAVDTLKNKRWVPYDSQVDVFSGFAPGADSWRKNPRTDQWPPASWYSGQRGQNFDQLYPGYPHWGTSGNQGGSPFWNSAASS